MPEAMQANHSDRVMQVFLKALDAVGGSRHLIEKRRLDWLSELMESAYVVVLQEDEHRMPEEISDLLGISRESVENILTGPTDTAVQRFDNQPPADPLDRLHIAGGLAKLGHASLTGASPQA